MPQTSPFGALQPANETIHDMILKSIRRIVAEQPGKKAFINGFDNCEFVTYERLHQAILSTTSFLETIAFSKEIACTVVATGYEFTSLVLAVLSRGGGFSGASPAFTARELESQFADCRCSVVLTSHEHVGKVCAAAANVPSIRKIIVVGMNKVYKKKKKQEATPSDFLISWKSVEETRCGRSDSVPVNLDHNVALLPYSSGTTGAAKGVMLTHRNLSTMLLILEGMNQRLRAAPPLDDIDFTNEHTLLFVPTYHIYGFAILAYVLYKGTTCITMKHFDPHTFCKTIQDFKLSYIRLVPPILVFMAKSPICSSYDLSSIRILMSGAAPAGRDLCEEVLRRFPNIKFIQQAYGMTELSFCSHVTDVQSRTKHACVGKIAPGLLGKIVDLKTGEECATGVPGEICVKGPSVMLGYLNRPEATRETIRDGWLHTGDIGYVDNDGDLFIVDRLKELIKVKGFQVPPAELEDILLSHPLITDAAVIGVLDEDAGELPRAFVVRKREGLSQKDVHDFVKGKVASYKQLKGGIEFVKEIPKTPSGKILRALLRGSLKAKI